RDGIDELIIGALTSLIGLISLFIGFTRRRQIQKFMFAFPLFASGTGLWMLFGSQLFVFLAGMPSLFFLLAIFFQAVWVVSLYMFHRQMLGSGPFGIINWIMYSSAFFMGLNVIFLISNQIQPQNNLYFNIMNIINYIILFLIILTLPVHALYRALSGDREAQILTLSIAVLASFGLREVLGDLDVFPRERIYYHYGVMIFIFLLGYLYNRRLIQTSEELIQKKMALSLAERDLEKSQLKLLQDRMNPHFLFNSLSALHALIEQKQSEKAGETAEILTDHYRFLTDQSSESLIPLEQELEFCENFLKMQEIRFGENFSYTLNYDRPLPSIQIPPLSVQPLIENSIKHGLRRRSGPGRIDVRIELLDDGCRIKVADNGDAVKTDDPYGRSLGNIQKRLRHFYKDADLTIQNQDPGPGVAVIIEFNNFIKENQTE
ncbi:MAG: histidine kinase, partial [Spirochaetia bacterium]|nr:histidine kinase [Spirochaetia bacterium]